MNLISYPCYRSKAKKQFVPRMMLRDLPSERILLDRNFSFFNGENAIDARDGQCLPCPARPMNLDFLNLRSRTQSEVHAWVGARTVTSTTHYVCPLPDSARCKEDLRADGVPWALWATTQFQRQPMITVLDDIAQQRRRRINIIDSHIDVPTIEEIPECCSSPGNDVGQTAAGGWWHFFELGPVKVPEKLRPLRPGRSPILPVYFRVHMTVDDKDVQQAIIVKVEETGSPSQKGDCRPRQIRPIRNVTKAAPAVISVECFVVIGKRCREEIDFPVAIVVAHTDTHGRLLPPVLAQSKSRGVTYIFKCPVVPIAVEIVGHGIISHRQVHPSIVIHVYKNSGQAIVAAGIGHPSFDAHVCKRTITIVTEQMVGLSRQTSRPAHHCNAAKLAKIGRNYPLSCDRWMIKIKLHVSWNKQIEPPVVVIITPRRSCRPSPQCHPSLLGDVGKSAVVVVVIQPVLAVVCDVDVRPAVIIVVPHGHAKSPAFVRDARLFGDIGKSAVMVIVEQHGSRRSLLPFQCRHRGTIQEINIEPAVVVIVEQRHTRTNSF